MKHTALLALVLLMIPETAFAQDAEHLEEYRQAAEEGQEAFNRGEIEEAWRLFQHARSVLPNPRVYRLLGRVAEARERYGEAVRMYRLALSVPENGNPLTAARRSEIETILLPQALARVGEILLSLEPADAAVTVDGAPADVQEGSLILPVGTYTLRVRYPGYQDHEQRIEIAARSREPLSIALQRTDGQASAPTTPAPGAPASTPAPDVTGPMVVLGLAAAGLLTFAVAGGMALGENSRLGDLCGATAMAPRTVGSCTDAELSDLHTMTAIADVGWITGAAGAAVGLIWLAVALSSRPTAEQAMRIAPWASANGGGVILAVEGL